MEMEEIEAEGEDCQIYLANKGDTRE